MLTLYLIAISGMNMTARTLAVSLISLGLLAACDSDSASLPQSSVLLPEQVQAIAQGIEQKYPNLSGAKQGEVLALAIRSLDEMIFVEGGEFEMGDFGWICDFDPAQKCDWPCGEEPENLCPITPDSDNPLHQVKLDSYYLASKKTTLKDFDLFREVHGLEIFDKTLRKREDLKDYYLPTNPAPTKDWQQAKDYCNWIGELSGYPVDLSTEAQWEFAARDRGEKILYPTNDGTLKIGKNFPDRNARPGHSATPTPVDSYPPNPLGIYMAAGSATEWVNDWYSENYYSESPALNPPGPEKGTEKVARGFPAGDSPWASAYTVMRKKRPSEGKGFYPTRSFRCSLQSSEKL
ncbi:formylglycine-generating enzyme family protein [Pseudomonas luteola]|uniref:PvdO protein n=2 Tax=Pseudomonas luteola TaxID=47886 RepID=A0A2X2BYV4_PSELU|nr:MULTISPECIES: SUMF1/EgtB/PvdO family nonheme iron enzyme [Pseudomonas]MCG7374006.1 formylglycine-generating enzyme family protein [Pseudomonas luteola]SHJ72764.1 Sulfatase-modifying factor enzyme 1 [Pseudomonas zeshuii]SPZ00183.1 PvdO protein [Pseudomonas luteola]